MSKALYPILWDGGVYLPEQRLWLDPVRPRPRAVISHAHSDHVARHDCAYATPATKRLVTHRQSWPGAFETLAYGQAGEVGGAKVTLLPAGHVLGSAQTLVETDHGRVLYTGDLKTRSGFTAAPAQLVRADILVIESTFGRPRYRFPEAAEVIAGIVDWCRMTLGNGLTPVLLGYSLGKGQEILSALASAGFDIVLHPSLFSVTEVYREFGCVFPFYRRFSGSVGAGSIIICPPRARSAQLFSTLPRFRTAVLSGWAIDSSLKDRLGVDAVFPLSDHADFSELCRYAEQVGATMTYTVLGFDEDLAVHLCRRGINARPLRAPMQLSLF